MTKAGVYDSDHGSLCKSEFICKIQHGSSKHVGEESVLGTDPL